jgi:hypothetical protein
MKRKEVAFVVIGHSQFQDDLWEILGPVLGKMSEFAMLGLLKACGCELVWENTDSDGFNPVVTAYSDEDSAVLCERLRVMVNEETQWHL